MRPLTSNGSIASRNNNINRNMSMKLPFSFPLETSSSEELSLTQVLALSRIPSSSSRSPRKIEKQKKTSKLAFAPDEQNETFEYESLSSDISLRDQIWYSVSYYFSMIFRETPSSFDLGTFVSHIKKCCIHYSLEQPKEFSEMAENLDEATRRRRKHIAGIRRCFVHTILDLQEEHRREGIHDPKGIACTAKRCTKYNSRDAATRGKEMAQEAAALPLPPSSKVQQSQTLDIIDCVLDLVGVTDSPQRPNRTSDTSLQPPRRLLSPLID